MSLTIFLLLQAALPPPATPYIARIEYQGPGVVCGAAFAIELQNGERATLVKGSFIDMEVKLVTSDGQFAIRESQYTGARGKVVRRLPGGSLKRYREAGEYRWSYTDGAPGSTDVYGPAVNSASATKALHRVIFGAIRNGVVGKRPCLAGVASEPRTS